ncbi:hypothetical protein D3C87_1631710 [compost metagenome]
MAVLLLERGGHADVVVAGAREHRRHHAAGGGEEAVGYVEAVIEHEVAAAERRRGLAGHFHGLRRVHAVRAGQHGREAQHEAVGFLEDGVVELADQFAEGLAFGIDGLAGLVLELAHAAQGQRQRIGAERDDLDDQHHQRDAGADAPAAGQRARAAGRRGSGE